MSKIILTKHQKSSPKIDFDTFIQTKLEPLRQSLLMTHGTNLGSHTNTLAEQTSHPLDAAQRILVHSAGRTHPKKLVLRKGRTYSRVWKRQRISRLGNNPCRRELCILRLCLQNAPCSKWIAHVSKNSSFRMVSPAKGFGKGKESLH